MGSYLNRLVSLLCMWLQARGVPARHMRWFYYGVTTAPAVVQSAIFRLKSRSFHCWDLQGQPNRGLQRC